MRNTNKPITIANTKDKQNLMIQVRRQANAEGFTDAAKFVRDVLERHIEKQR